MVYRYRGVSARERPDGQIIVRGRSGNYVTLTKRVSRAVRMFMAAVKEQV